MKATITKTNVGEPTIVKLEGKITIGQGDLQLRDLITQLRNEGHTKILLDLSGVTRIDSSGLGELIGSYTTISNAGGRLVLIGLPTKLNDILHSTQFISLFELADNPQEGLELLSN